jgi:ribosomal protein S18 acetylase RimI-like enzyme
MRDFRPTLEKNQKTLEFSDRLGFLSGLEPSKVEVFKPIIRSANRWESQQIYELYQVVSTLNLGNLTQEEDEITLKYVGEEVEQGLARGLVLVLEQENQIIGYLKAFTSPFRCLAHVLTNATMMVHPEWQGKGYGGQLMDAYLAEIRANMPHILRFELLPHQCNQKAIKFYESHGFCQESVAKNKIRNPRGYFDSEVVMVWFNSNFSEEGLARYHAFKKHENHSHKGSSNEDISVTN